MNPDFTTSGKILIFLSLGFLKWGNNRTFFKELFYGLFIIIHVNHLALEVNKGKCYLKRRK